ncbi:MAG: autotransporter-associated beta strand repeat-containing protein [Verrucomicrobiota bacterium]
MKINPFSYFPTISSAHVRHAAIIMTCALVVQPASADNTWDGGGTTGNWNEAGFLNWGGNTTPASPTALQFGGILQLSSNNDLFAAGTLFNGITFNAGAGAFTITGNSINLGGNVVNNSSNNQTINLDLAMTGNRTFTTNASGNLTLGGVVSGSFNFIKSGLGTLTINGSSASTFSAQTQVGGGTLLLDFANMATPTNLIASTNTIQAGGGELYIKGKTGVTATSQTLGNLTQAGTAFSRVTVDSNGGPGTTLALGTIAKTAGNTTLFDITTAGSVITTSTAASASGLLNTAFLAKDSGGIGFATKTGANITRYDDATLATTLAAGATVSTTNYTTLGSAASVVLTAGGTMNALVIDTTSGTRAIDLSAGVKGLTSLGVLFRGSNDATISNGQIGAAAVETMIHQFGAGKLTISGTVGSGGGALTKDGTGELALSGANTYSGDTRVLDGTVTVTGSIGTGNIIVGSVGTGAINPVVTFNSGSSYASTSATAIRLLNPNSVVNINQANLLSNTTNFTLTAGTLNLNADNSTAWTSATPIALSGATVGILTLGLGHDNALGARPLTFGNSTLVANGGTRTINNAISISNGTTTTVGGSNNMTLNGMVTFIGGTNTFLTSNNTATTNYAGGITIRNDGSVAERFPTISNTGSGTMIISAPIVNGSSLDGRLIFGGTGIVNLNAANTYTGTNTVNAGATVKLGNGAGLGFGGAMANTIGSLTTVSSGAAIDLNGQTVNELIAINGTGVGGSGALINSNTGTPSVIGGGLAVVAPNSAVSGSGYSSAPTVTIADPVTGTTATAAASLGLTAASFNIVSGDIIYTTAPTVTITSGGGVGAIATAVLSGGATGTVIGVTITNGGKDFTTAPTIAFTGGTVSSGTVAPTGTGNATNFGVRAISLSGAGTGYTVVPTVSFSGGGGTGAAATASLTTVNLASASSIGGAGDITVNAVVSGASMTKVGAGKVTLAGNNTYAGTTISTGILQVGAGGTIGTLGTGAVTNNALLTFNRSDSATVANAIGGTGAIDQQGVGTTIFTGANNYAGTTTISAGILQVGAGGIIGTLGTGAVTDNALLVFNRSDALTVANAIGGSGAIEKQGAGTTTLTAANTYTGITTVSAGTLVINGDQTSAIGAVTVAAGATLKGSGTIGGATTIQSGGIHAPGNSPGIEKFTSDLTYADGSIFAWDIDRTLSGRGTGYDGVNVTGALAGLDGADAGSTLNAVFRIVIGDSDFSDAFWSANDHTWNDIFTNADGTTAKANWADIFGGGFEYYNSNGSALAGAPTTGSFTLTGSTLSWNYSAVPEISNALAGVLLGAGLLRRKRQAA